MIPHARSAEHYARVERERRADERWIDALRRIAIEDAVAATSTQKEAAGLVGLHPSNLCFHLRQQNPEARRGSEAGRLRAQAVTRGLISA